MRGPGYSQKQNSPASDPFVSEPTDVGTRERILQLIVEQGPITASEIASELELAAAGIRRHLGCLEEDAKIRLHNTSALEKGRGRPAKSYIATSKAHSEFSGGYHDLANQALVFLAETAGEDAVTEFANKRSAALEAKYRNKVTAAEPHQRVEQLADALSADGFAATVRPTLGVTTLQLCQGHCPVQEVAAEFPQLCEAESQAFSRILGIHTQRLSTIANGGHVCTTNIPIQFLQLREGEAS